jgi:hypothetical protein
MNFTELLLNSYQYDIQEVVDNSVQKIKTQRNQQQQALRKLAQKSNAVKEKEKREAARQEAIDRYKKARTEYQIAQDEAQALRQKKVTPSFKEKMGMGLEKAGKKLQDVDVTDPVALGRNLAKGVGNLPTKIVGKSLSKLGGKLSGSEISRKKYEAERERLYNKEADKRLEMDTAEVEAMGRHRTPNPQREVQKQKQKQKEKQELNKTAKQMGAKKYNAAQKIEQELRDQGQKEKQQPPQPTTQQKTTTASQPQTQTTTQNTPQKERSFGSKLFANQSSASRVASQMRRGYTGDSQKDIRFTKPTQTNFPATQQTQQSTPTPSIAQRKQTVTNKPTPQSQQNNPELTKPTSQIVKDINPEPTAGQPPQGSKPEAFARPTKPQQTQQSQQEPNNKTLQQRKRFSAPYSKKIVPGSSSLGSLSKVVKQVDPSGYGDD